MLGHLGGKLGPESAKMATKRARWSQHGGPGGSWKYEGGLMVNERVWGPYSLLNSLAES